MTTATITDGDVLVPWGESWAALSRYWVRSEHGRLVYTHVSGDAMSEASSISLDADAPDPKTVFIKPRVGTVERTRYIHLQSYFGGHLASGPRSLARMLSGLTEANATDTEFVKGCVRVMVAEGELLAEGPDSAVKLRLSNAAKEQERRRAYVSSFAHELTSQAEQIGLLIGHNPTVGNYREELFRALLNRHIPRRFHAATGFIAGIPNQIDILIYDQIDYAPLFRAGDLVVVPAGAVRALVEIKSNLTTKELKDALKHLKEAAPLRLGGPPVFTGIFAYAGATAATLMAGWRAFHKMRDDETGAELDKLGDVEPEAELDEMHLIHDVGTTVTAICVLRRSMLASAFVPAKINGDEGFTPALMQIESFAGRSSEAAVFYDTLSRYLRHPFAGPLPMDGTHASVHADSTVTQYERAYADRRWGTYMLDGEDVERFEADLQAYEQWLDGGAWKLPEAV